MIGRKAGELLLSILEAEKDAAVPEGARVDVGFELIVRETTRRLNV